MTRDPDFVPLVSDTAPTGGLPLRFVVDPADGTVRDDDGQTPGWIVTLDIDDAKARADSFAADRSDREPDPSLTFSLRVERRGSNLPHPSPSGVRAWLGGSLSEQRRARTAEAAGAAALAAAAHLPSEATLRAVLAHEQAWRNLEERWGTLSSTEVAKAMGRHDGDLHLWATAQAHDLKLLAVERGSLVFPGFQLHPVTGEPSPAMPAILDAFVRAGWDNDSVALWFTGPQGSANGAVPAAILHTAPDLALAAARITAAG